MCFKKNSDFLDKVRHAIGSRIEVFLNLVFEFFNCIDYSIEDAVEVKERLNNILKEIGNNFADVNLVHALHTVDKRCEILCSFVYMTT